MREYKKNEVKRISLKPYDKKDEPRDFLMQFFMRILEKYMNTH